MQVESLSAQAQDLSKKLERVVSLVEKTRDDVGREILRLERSGSEAIQGVSDRLRPIEQDHGSRLESRTGWRKALRSEFLRILGIGVVAALGMALGHWLR